MTKTSKTFDMKGIPLEVGNYVRKHSIINDLNSNFKLGKVKQIAPMHEGGEEMVWTESGGAHYPKACLIIDEKNTEKRKDNSWTKNT